MNETGRPHNHWLHRRDRWPLLARVCWFSSYVSLLVKCSVHSFPLNVYMCMFHLCAHCHTIAHTLTKKQQMSDIPILSMSAYIWPQWEDIIAPFRKVPSWLLYMIVIMAVTWLPWKPMQGWFVWGFWKKKDVEKCFQDGIDCNPGSQLLWLYPFFGLLYNHG